jgi:hypothetical protein
MARDKAEGSHGRKSDATTMQQDPGDTRANIERVEPVVALGTRGLSEHSLSYPTTRVSHSVPHAELFRSHSDSPDRSADASHRGYQLSPVPSAHLPSNRTRRARHDEVPQVPSWW